MNNSVAQSQDVQQHQYLTLLDLSKALTLHRSLSDLLHDLAERLTNLFDFNYLSVILHDGQQNVMRLHMIETTEPTLRELPTEINIEGSIAGLVWQSLAQVISELNDAKVKVRLVTRPTDSAGRRR